MILLWKTIIIRDLYVHSEMTRPLETIGGRRVSGMGERLKARDCKQGQTVRSGAVIVNMVVRVYSTSIAYAWSEDYTLDIASGC
jgi:hypothetical protein